MISAYDYVIIAVYLGFMLSLGLVFKRLSNNTSDYFRCGGGMPWWITGTSAWIASFSAWTFVGAAGEVYRSGYTVIPVFFAMIPALVLVLAFTCVRFRRLRVITWMEGVRERFGPGTEQFYTWLKVPMQLFFSAMYLMSIAVFMAAVFKIEVWKIQIMLGLVITIVAFAGGAFAVLASDFVQMFLVMTITIVTVVLTLRQPEIGGLSGLFSQLQAKHPDHLYWWKSLNLPILFAYLFSFVWIKTGEQNNFENATMYLMPKSDTHARRMVLIPLFGSMIGPLIWTIPPLAATLMFSNEYLVQFAAGRLSQPTETAFVAVAMKVLPVGLIGLLLCAMFGATLTSMDAGVNKCVGVFVRSFYGPIIKPQASEKHLLFVGKMCTLVFGVIIIATSILVNSGRSKDLFSFMNQVGMSLAIPLWLPLFYGLFFKRTPDWSARVTAYACFLVVIWTNFILSDQIKQPDFLQHVPGFLLALLGNPGSPLSAQDQTYFLFAATAICTTVVGTVVFFASVPFYKSSPAAHLERVEALFERLRTPVTTDRVASLSDEPLYRLLGTLCMVYGLFVLALMAIPNPLIGRLAFLFIGGVIAVGGLVLYLVAKRKRREVAEHQVTADMGSPLTVSTALPAEDSAAR